MVFLQVLYRRMSFIDRMTSIRFSSVFRNIICSLSRRIVFPLGNVRQSGTVQLSVRDTIVASTKVSFSILRCCFEAVMRILSVSHSAESLFSGYFSLSGSFCFSLSLLASHPLSGSPSTSRAKRTTPVLALMRKLRSSRRKI